MERVWSLVKADPVRLLDKIASPHEDGPEPDEWKSRRTTGLKTPALQNKGRSVTTRGGNRAIFLISERALATNDRIQCEFVFMGNMVRGISVMTNAWLAIAFCMVLSACDNSPPGERLLFATTESYIRSHDPGDRPVSVEYASQAPDKSSVCGFVTVGSRKHLPYVIQKLPGGAMVTVDMVLDRPLFVGQSVEPEATQAARIKALCKQLGHNLT
ncbi:MAG: hypothetical protein JWR80_5821 [Bradyrhizobium sp.]|nr:hypothetical protein [Bradyrhizobium sp.]